MDLGGLARQQQGGRRLVAGKAAVGREHGRRVRLDDAVGHHLDRADLDLRVRRVLLAQGVETVDTTPEQFAALMRAHGVDMWVVPMREYNEDPVFSSITAPETFAAHDMMQLVGYDMTRAAARQVYDAAGIGPEDVDVIELHDCFAQNELISYEALGFCAPGKALPGPARVLNQAAGVCYTRLHWNCYREARRWRSSPGHRLQKKWP